MAKGKKTEEETLAVQGIANHKLEGGPRAGERLRMTLIPRPYIRLAFPEWCTYRWDPTRKAYVYVGKDPPPKFEDPYSGPSMQPRVEPISQEAMDQLDAYRHSEAYQRGLRQAEENLQGLP